MRKRLLSILAALAASGLAAVSAVATTVAPTPPGTSFVVNNGPGEQTNPHVSGNLVSYTDDPANSGLTSIHYYDLATHVDNTIPNDTPGATDYLSDIDGSRIVFSRDTRETNGAIMLFDTATPATGPMILAPQTGSARTNASIGGNTVAWEDLEANASGDGEIVAYDIPTGTTTQLTNDLMENMLPAVSPDGNVIVWVKCDAATHGNCDVWEATRSAGLWSTTALTTDHSAARPDTNGSLVVYGKGGAAGSDVFVQPVGGGTEQNLTSLIGGANTNPSMSGNVIAFEHTPSGQTQADVWATDLTTGATFPLTNTPTSESLTDVSVTSTGMVTVVWMGDYAVTGEDVLGYRYSLDAPLTITHTAAGAGELHAAAGVTFTDADPAGALSQYSATIDWGDGSSSPATVVKNPFGGFAAGGLHTYSAAGTYTVTITVNDVGGALATSSASLVATS